VDVLDRLAQQTRAQCRIASEVGERRELWLTSNGLGVYLYRKRPMYHGQSDDDWISVSSVKAAERMLGIGQIPPGARWRLSLNAAILERDLDVHFDPNGGVADRDAFQRDPTPFMKGRKS
jgi:hypothetical protein